MDNNEGEKITGTFSRVILGLIKNPIILMPILALGFAIFVVFLLIAIFASDSRHGLFNRNSECTATSIKIDGTVEGEKVNLTLSAESINIKGINGTIQDGKFTATRKLTEEEKQKLNGSNEMKIWNFFRMKGYSEAATAAIMGNMYVESGLNPEAVESNGVGHGLIQWSFGRYAKLKSFAASKGTDWTDLNTQLLFLEKEINNETVWLSHIGGNSGLTSWKKGTDVNKLTTEFCTYFERPGIPHLDKRINKANEYYNKYKGNLAIGDIKLNGTIKEGVVKIDGSVGDEPITSSGEYKNGKITTSGYLGDTAGCEGINVCGIAWPTGKDYRSIITSNACVPRWGTYHCGDDIGVGIGTKVYAIMDGTVVRAGVYGGYGNCVEIKHGDVYNNGKTVYTLYGHLSSIKVKVGQTVTAGTVVALSGNTGHSTGPHLHVEINYNMGGADKSSACPTSLCYRTGSGIRNQIIKLQKNSVEKCDNSEVVAYAKKFVGKPYKLGGSWNGEEPWTPTDCSGFVKGVYKHFGVDLPRDGNKMCSSDKVKTVAGANSLEGVKPGDIFCYGSHVSIYIGNKQVISNGGPDPYKVRIKKYNYRSYNKVVRVK